MAFSEQTEFRIKIGLFASLMLGSVYVGATKQSFDSRVSASEKHLEDIDKELQFRAQIRQQLMEELHKISERLARIEGKLEGVRREIHQ